MRHELYETLYIYNSLHRIGNRISNNSDFQLFSYIFIFLIILPLIIPLVIFYAIFYCFNSGYNELKNNKSEFIDNKTFLKLLIPITIIIASAVTAIIKFFH